MSFPVDIGTIELWRGDNAPAYQFAIDGVTLTGSGNWTLTVLVRRAPATTGGKRWAWSVYGGGLTILPALAATATTPAYPQRLRWAYTREFTEALPLGQPVGFEIQRVVPNGENRTYVKGVIVCNSRIQAGG